MRGLAGSKRSLHILLMSAGRFSLVDAVPLVCRQKKKKERRREEMRENSEIINRGDPIVYRSTH